MQVTPRDFDLAVTGQAAFVGDWADEAHQEPADFRTTVEYTGPLEHQYLMTHFREDYLSLWLDMRELLATTGIIRPFFKSRQVWKYVDLPDGFTYWVMPEWVVDRWEERFDPNETYVLNRQETEKHFQTGAQ